MNTTIIGVAGGTASGKSTLVKKLQEAFEGESVITLCHDYYYKAHDDLSFGPFILLSIITVRISPSKSSRHR